MVPSTTIKVGPVEKEGQVRNCSSAQLAALAGHKSWVGAMAYFPTWEIMASGSDDGVFHMWKLTNEGEYVSLLSTVAEHVGAVLALALLPGYTNQSKAAVMASGSADRYARTSSCSIAHR